MTNAIVIANEAEFNRLANAIRSADEVGEDVGGLMMELADFCLRNAKPDQTAMAFAFIIYNRLRRLNKKLRVLENDVIAEKSTTLARANIAIETGLMIGACEGFFTAHGIGLDEARTATDDKH